MKQTIVYLTWFCVLFATLISSSAPAQVCVMENGEDDRRTRNAYILAGLTVVGIAGGIVALSNASGHHHHHSSSSYSYSSYSPYRYSYSNSHHHHHHKHHRNHHHHHHSSKYSIFSKNNVSSWSGSGSSLSSYQSDGLDPLFGARKSGCGHSKQEEVQVSGLFTSNACLADDGHASCSVFVQLPDGTSRSLGSIPLTGSGSLSCGPFDQKGSYTFGISLDQGLEVSSQTKIGTLEVQVNGSTLQRHDFYVPPHAGAYYEPVPCHFEAR